MIESEASLLRVAPDFISRNDKARLTGWGTAVLARFHEPAIVGAEVIMRWLPKGTHEWNKFITPDELAAFLKKPKTYLKI